MGRQQGGGEGEYEREAVRVREMPCVGMSGWHSAGCLQSVILTPFPDKQISMWEKYIVLEPPLATEILSSQTNTISHEYQTKGEMKNQEETDLARCLILFNTCPKDEGQHLFSQLLTTQRKHHEAIVFA